MGVKEAKESSHTPIPKRTIIFPEWPKTPKHHNTPPMRLFKGIALLLIVLALAFAGFFFWARSGTLADDEFAVLTVYDDGAVRPAALRDTFSVMTYNLGYLSATANNRPVKTTAAFFAENMEAAAALIRRVDPDIIAFQEIDFGGGRSYEVHQLDTLAARGGYSASATAVNWDKRYVPFPSANPLLHFGSVLSGQAVLSRYPIRQHERVVLERAPYPFYYDAFYLDRLAQVVVVDLGRPLVLINVHLEAYDAATRQRQARQVRTLVERYRDTHAVVLLGDFNSLLPVSKLSPLLPARRRAYFANDQTLETLLAGSGLREAFADTVYRAAEAATLTFPADAPTVKIDHIFYEPDDIEAVEAFVVGGPHQPSDHRAVVMRFVFRE